MSVGAVVPRNGCTGEGSASELTDLVGGGDYTKGVNTKRQPLGATLRLSCPTQQPPEVTVEFHLFAQSDLDYLNLFFFF